MDIDYPASHSMDAVWYAVDEAGHVGMFFTGEEGHLPTTVADIEDQVSELSGLYFFQYEEDYRDIDTPVAPYRLTAAPDHPLHVDQLPPVLREQVSQVRFAGVDFAASELVQPVEHAACHFWSDGELAYLASDGKTVRPIPGMEDRFVEFCKKFREEHPEQAKDMIFEGLKDEPKQPRLRRRKENDNGQ